MFLYHLSSPAYSSGLSASFKISDGPLQSDSYQLTVAAGLTDKSGNPLANAHVRTSRRHPCRRHLKGRSDETFGTATPLGSAGSGFAGSFTGRHALGRRCRRLSRSHPPTSQGRQPRLRHRQYNTNTVSVFCGNGDGTFSRTDYTVGSNPIAVVIADLMATASSIWRATPARARLPPTRQRDGNLQAKASITPPQLAAVAAVDLNGAKTDCRPSYSSGVGLLLNKTTAAAPLAPLVWRGGLLWHGRPIPTRGPAGDFNVTARPTWRSPITAATASPSCCNGDGTFGAARRTRNANNPAASSPSIQRRRQTTIWRPAQRLYKQPVGAAGATATHLRHAGAVQPGRRHNYPTRLSA